MQVGNLECMWKCKFIISKLHTAQLSSHFFGSNKCENKYILKSGLTSKVR